MIGAAAEKLTTPDIEFQVADAEEVDLQGSFDLVTSNACFQWFADLSSAIKKYKRLLPDEGIILFSIFGPRTFAELNFCLQNVLGLSQLSVNGFVAKEALSRMLQSDYRQVEVKEAAYTEVFASLGDLLRKIRYAGIGGEGLRKGGLLTPRVLAEIERVYLGRFKGIKAAYQVFFCQGRK
jgi:malonyl-CoA O-methyltransferase